MDKNAEENFGEIVSFLIKEKFITRENVEYAARVQSKLVSQKSLIDVLKDLNYINDDQIKTTLKNSQITMRIGDLLVDLGIISKEKLDAAFEIQKKEEKPKKIGAILIEQRFVSEAELIGILSLQLGFPYTDPVAAEIEADLFYKAPAKWYRSHNFIPIKSEEDGIVIAFSDPLDQEDIKGAKDLFGDNIKRAIASQNEIERAIDKNLNLSKKGETVVAVDEDSITGIVNSIIKNAASEDVSDIHIEPLRDRLQVRFRQDGILIHYKDFPKNISPSLVSRIKVLSGSDITEKRRHQGGRISFEHGGQDLDLRVSYYVTIYGEKVVLRILNKMDQLIDINDIGMQPKILDRFLNDALDVPSGVMIVTGPTGSGKTTTVYSCIKHIHKPNISIITAEEPVEYIIDGISQCSINPKINLTFEETLRHVVRQDPDVIVIGEIRDKYSADVAVHAALTGHKVLTTFHTEDSIGGLIRLLNMDIEAFLISSTVVCVLAQRLLRKTCFSCGKPYKPNPVELSRIGYSQKDISNAEFRKGAGCPVCRHTGYKGRMPVFEMLILNEVVRDEILNNSSSYQIRKISIDNTGLVTLLEDAVYKAALGQTTLEEVFRCVPRLIMPRPFNVLHRLLGA